MTWYRNLAQPVRESPTSGERQEMQVPSRLWTRHSLRHVKYPQRDEQRAAEKGAMVMRVAPTPYLFLVLSKTEKAKEIWGSLSVKGS